MSERKSTPTATLTILGLVGLYAASRGLPPGASGPTKTDGPAVSRAAESDDTPPARVVDPQAGELETLKPLLDIISGEAGHDRPKTFDDLIKALKHSNTGVRCITATIADPVRCSINFRFDEILSAIQRAAETENYVLDRWRLPWASPQRKVTKSLVRRDSPDEVRVETHEAAAAGSHRPGLLVFRGKAEMNVPRPLLLVFLVAEIPSAGIDQEALRESLDLTQKIDRGTKVSFPDGYRVRIIGPNFSGSAPSIERALAHWIDADPKQDNTPNRNADTKRDMTEIRIISGNAQSISKDSIEKLGGIRKGKVSYSSTIHSGTAVLDCLLHYLDPDDYRTRAANSPVYLLIESNTGGGQGWFSGYEELEKKNNIRKKELEDKRWRPEIVEGLLKPDLVYQGNARAIARKQLVVSIPFPFHIAEIRRLYESQGLLHNGVSEAIRAAGQIAVPGDSPLGARDFVPQQTPGPTAHSENLVLSQALTDLARRKPEFVGIWATDPNDAVFLARLVRQYCRDAQLFTTQAEILFLDPTSIADLRGMLVGSTYPLFPRNQDWTTAKATEADRRIFPSQNAQGVYNATVAQLWEARTIDLGRAAGQQTEPQFQEYAAPRPSLDVPSQPEPHPLVWISVVGERGFFPVGYGEEGKDGDQSKSHLPEIDVATQYLYTYKRQAGVPIPVEKDARDLRVPYPILWALVLLATSFGCFALALAGGHYLCFAREVRPASALAMIFISGFKKRYRYRPLLAGVMFFRALMLSSACRARYLNRPLLRRIRFPRTSQSPATPRTRPPRSGLRARLSLVRWGWRELRGLILRFDVFLWDALRRRSPWDTLLYPGKRRRKLPGFYLLVAMVSVLAGYLIIAWPLVPRLARGIPWGRQVPMRMAGLVAMSMGLLLLGTFVACLVFWLGRERPRGRLLGLCLGLVAVVLARGAIWWFIEFNHLGGSVVNFLSMDRLTTLSGGVSPIFPAVFLVSAYLALSYERLSQAYRFNLYSFDHCSDLATRPGLDETDPLKMLPWLLEQVDRRFSARFADSATKVWLVVASFVSLAVLVPIGLSLPWTHTIEGPAFDLPFRAAFLFMYLTVAFQTLELAITWQHVHQLLNIAVQLPMVRAFDRMPIRVAGWFFEVPAIAGGRHALATQQARALLAMSEEPAVNDACDEAFKSDKWEEIQAHLKETIPNRRSFKAVWTLMKALREAYWSKLPVTTAYGDPPNEKAEVSARNEGAGGVVVPDKFRPWAEMAEDFIALQTVRWVALTMTQLWMQIGFLVIAALALLLATTSYPFALQGRVMVAVGLLIAGIVAAVLSVILGSNRDELISRVANNKPGRLTLDSALIGNLATYMIPLLAIPAALSFDFADLLRSWFDPIFRLIG